MGKNKLYNALETMTFLGIDCDYKGLSLCNLAHFSQTRGMLKRKYQVDCDTAEVRFSQIYSHYETAIDKFVALYSSIKAKEQKLREMNEARHA